jgi:hypothetical protein
MENKKTRVLLISGDDYGANNFINKHGGKLTSKVIDNISYYESDEGLWDLSVHEFDGEINLKFLKFIKNKIMGDGKIDHINLFIENQKIKY